jgi:hypothetical protein
MAIDKNGNLLIRIICDGCDFKTAEDQYIKDWYKRKCPYCGKELINDLDMKRYKKVELWHQANLLFMKLFPKEKTRKIRYSSKDDIFTVLKKGARK